jgi:AraC family transcriptional regulator of adaptative response/methylated-DNA-[protein]-cysteine methyltransferase
MEKQKNTFIALTHFETDLGWMIAAASPSGICMLEYTDYKLLNLELRQLADHFNAPLAEGDSPYFDLLKEQMMEYFNKERSRFDVSLDLVGTEFQKEVWLSLLHIPYGHTTTYARQAALIGKPSAVRAVAGANGRNKISIVLPCHRVIGTDGSLTGYGGGLRRKQFLLELERQ